MKNFKVSFRVTNHIDKTAVFVVRSDDSDTAMQFAYERLKLKVGKSDSVLCTKVEELKNFMWLKYIVIGNTKYFRFSKQKKLTKAGGEVFQSGDIGGVEAVFGKMKPNTSKQFKVEEVK